MTASCSPPSRFTSATFIGVSYRIEPPKDLPAAIDVRIRAFGTCAFLMLTVILAIGPLARLHPWFRKLLFNRRHFGVLTFVIAPLHAWFMIEWYEAQGNLPNLVAELTTWSDYGKFIGFPFKVHRSRRAARCCSCWRRPAMISGCRFSRRRSGSGCT